MVRANIAYLILVSLMSSVNFPLPGIEVNPLIYNDLLSTDLPCNSSTSPQHKHSPKSPPIGFASTSTTVHEPISATPSSRSILHDMFLSQRTTGIRASLFRCSEEHLRFLCCLHGLQVLPSFTVRQLRTVILHHVMNGHCGTARCLPSSPSPDRSACLCIAREFSSPLSITTFIIEMLKGASPSAAPTENLLLVVESCGTEPPYRNRRNLRRHLLRSLQTFLHLCSCQGQLQHFATSVDPFGDLLSGFEQKRKPVLESIMSCHGLSIHGEKRMSSEAMRNTILAHVTTADCACSMDRKITLPSRWPLPRQTIPTLRF